MSTQCLAKNVYSPLKVILLRFCNYQMSSRRIRNTLAQRFPYILHRGALFRTEIRRGALSSHLNQRHVCAYLATLRSIILAAYTVHSTLQELNNFYPVLTYNQFMAAQIHNFQILSHLFYFSFPSLCGALGDASRSTVWEYVSWRFQLGTRTLLS